jgi:hypothetical protein
MFFVGGIVMLKRFFDRELDLKRLNRGREEEEWVRILGKALKVKVKA